MSAIGSLIVMSCVSFPPRFPPVRCRGPAATWVLPRALGDARQLAGVGHLTDADAAQSEDAVDRAGSPAARTAGVAAHLELGGAPRLGDHRLGCHASGLLEREAEGPQQGAALVVGAGGGDERDVHPARTVDRVRVDLVEHRLLGQAEGVVAVAIELAAVEPAE